MAEPKKINLALQGGGAHGALTWGVLDHLCADPRLTIDAISACSAGAMNAVVYAYGNMKGGAKGAQQALYDFWKDISVPSHTLFPDVNKTWANPFFSIPRMDQALSYLTMESFTKLFSPYQFNPFNVNPLRDVLNRHVNFNELGQDCAARLFITATNVRTNKIHLFHGPQISLDAVMASACLPALFQAVEINGEAYWDGGYMGNPALYPLIYDTKTDDILVVNVNPIYRADIPKTPQDIFNRINEISFNSSLLRELRAIEFARRLVEDEMIKPEFRGHFKFHKINMHMISADKVMADYGEATKYIPDWEMLTTLRDQGRAMAAAWLDECFDKIGKSSTINLRDIFE